MIAIGIALVALAATPANFAQKLAVVRGGDTLVLAPGNYVEVAFRKRDFSPPLTIEAGTARFRFVAENSSGIRVVGGILGPALGDDPENTWKLGPLGYAAKVTRSRDIGFNGTTFADAVRGLVIHQSTDIKIDRGTLTRLKSDGINISSSQRVTVNRSTCTEFSPRKGDHPDCIQMWSRPGWAPTGNVTLTNNVSKGEMQGFTGFNHVRNGVDDGGFDNIVIENNRITGTYPQGIALGMARNSRVVGNTTRTLPGARWRVNVNVRDCDKCVVERNDIGFK